VKITVRGAAHPAPPDSRERLRAQSRVLTDLSSRLSVHNGDFRASVRGITEAAVNTLGIDRASVWVFEQFSDCVDIFERLSGRHRDGVNPVSLHSPAYVRALEKERYEKGGDSEASREFSESYLTPRGMSSLLAVAVRLRGAVAGVLCLERIGSLSDWRSEEHGFAHALADLVTTALEAVERRNAEQALRESEERYRDLVENSADLICTHDLQGKIESVNRALLSCLGYERPEEVVGRNVSEFLAPDVRDKFPAYLEEIIDEGNSRGFMKVVNRAGEVRILEYNNSLRLAGVREPIIRGMGRDVTERKKSEDALKASQTRYRHLFEGNLAGVYQTNLQGKILDCNHSFARILGYPSREEVLRQRAEDFYFNQSDREALLQRLRSSRELTGQELRLKRRDGTPLWALVNVSLVEGGEGREEILEGTLLDISERKKAEEALRRRAEFERIITTISTEFITLAAREINSAVHRALQTMGEFAGVESGFVFVFTDEGQRADKTHEWRAHGGRASSARPRGLPVKRFPWAMGKLRWFETIEIPRVSQLPPEAVAERQLAEGCEAVVVVPMVLGGCLTGVIGLADRRPVDWTEETVALLKIAGEIVASAIERERVERALRDSERRYRLLFERNLAGVYRSTLEGRILDCNDACARILGFASREELLAYDKLDFYFNLSERDAVLAQLEGKPSVTNFEVCLRRRDGSPVWVLENVSLLKAEEGEAASLEGTLIDITDRKRAEEQIEHHAYHDALTGLPNRMLMSDHLTLALSQAHREGRRLAVLFLDLDHFKIVNDSLGHAVGDELLRAVAARLKDCVRGDDTVARVGGDEFVLLLHNVSQAEDAAKVAEKILDSLKDPFLVGEHRIYTTTSIGISLYPNDGDDSVALLKNADSAMYRAKDLGRDNYQLCDPAIRVRALERLSLERGLQRALENGEFLLYYQPQVSMRSGQIVGFEALLRWRDPERGLIMPADFIPLAEENRLILPIGEWVLREALRQASRWHRHGYPHLRVGINLSARQFQHGNLTATVEHALRQAAVSPETVEFEITESVAMEDVEKTVALFGALKDMGVMISIDDFGTGQSSLSYLKRYPINSVKIDRAFVRDAVISPADAAIVKAVIEIAHGLRLRVVAEGVDSEDQRRLLREWRCDEMQGHLYSRPLPAKAFEDLLEKKLAAKKT
jgi:diguanylate cyclase (GGDEF)-like protein/PAS domain S-box-containing protein